MTFTEAVERFGKEVTQEDLQWAYKTARQVFDRELEQTFIVMKKSGRIDDYNFEATSRGRTPKTRAYGRMGWSGTPRGGRGKWTNVGRGGGGGRGGARGRGAGGSGRGGVKGG